MKKPLFGVRLFLVLVPALVASNPERLPPPREPDVAPRPALFTPPFLPTPQPEPVSETVRQQPHAPATKPVSPIEKNERGAIAMLRDVQLSRATVGAQTVRKAGYVYAVFRGDTESEWIAYAWPEEYGRTGRLTFMLKGARILETDSSRYSDAGPFPEAAIKPSPGRAGTLRDPAAVDSTGSGGQA